MDIRFSLHQQTILSQFGMYCQVNVIKHSGFLHLSWKCSFIQETGRLQSALNVWFVVRLITCKKMHQIITMLMDYLNVHHDGKIPTALYRCEIWCCLVFEWIILNNKLISFSFSLSAWNVSFVQWNMQQFCSIWMAHIVVYPWMMIQIWTLWHHMTVPEHTYTWEMQREGWVQQAVRA